MNKVNINYTTDSLVVGDGVQTDSVKPTAATKYERGDLLVVGADNSATHTLDGSDFHVVCAENVTAEQADLAIANGYEIPVYTQGELSADAVKINGALLNEGQKDTVRARANQATSLEIRKIAK